MKRILSILLAVTLLIASGCAGNSGNVEQPGDTTNNVENNDITNTTPPDETVGEDPEDSSDAGENAPETDVPDYSNSDYHPTETGWKLGNTIADFSFTTYKGDSYTLSAILAEKDAVLINIFATWCGPCKSEFPFMEKVYKQLQDKIEIIALSGDGSDTAQGVRQLATSLGLTFPMGLDNAGISQGIKLSAYPTTLIVDRFGTIVFMQVGSFDDETALTNMFEFLICDEYTESVVLDKVPPAMPHLDKLSDEALSEALGAEGIVFTNTPGSYSWPMALAEIDGRTTLVTTNKSMYRSRCSVQTTVTAAAGEVFAFDMKLSSELGYDFFILTVNGETVKAFSGEKDWMTYAYAFSADGEYQIELAYLKDDATDAGDDTLWLDNVRILSGDEAAAALAGNPAYPTASEMTFGISNTDTMEVVFEDPYKVVYKIFGCPYTAYLVNGTEVNCVITITDDIDPEAAVCYDNQGNIYTLNNIATRNGYQVSFTIKTIDDGGKGYIYVTFDPDALTDGDIYPIVLFADEAGLEKFTKSFAAGAWHDASEWGTEEEEEPLGDVVYTIRCVNENGEGISGVTLQICNDSTCSLYVTDANGECVLTLPSDNYEIHVLKAPEGIVFDSAEVIEAPIEGGELTITLKHE